MARPCVGVLGLGVVLWLTVLGVPAGAQELPSAGYAVLNGDINGDQVRDLSDPISLLGYLFSGGEKPVPLALCGTDPTAVTNGDTNGDRVLDLSDPIFLLGWLFSGGPEPVTACGEGQGGAKNPNPRVIPIHARAHGKSYGDWGAAWWRWALGIAAAVNPVTDTTGEHCDEGQSGSVWNLAGSFGSNETRSCTVPTGKTIFIPLLNYVFWTPEDLDFANSIGVPGATTEEIFRNMANGFLAHVTSLSCTVDGVSLNDLLGYRAASSPGTTPLMLGPNNVLADFGYPDGLREESVSDGFWLLLAPLSRGHHTITFSSALSCTPTGCFGQEFSFGLTITYHLTVQ